MKSYKLKDVTEIITCGVAKRPEYTQDGIMFLSSQNVKSNRMILDKYNYISHDDYKRLTKINKPEKGDILYTRVGSFGEATVIDIDDKFAIYVSLTLIKPKREILNSRYLMHFLNSPTVKQFAKNNTRGIGVQNLNVDTVREFDIVVPNMENQHKVVQILDKAQILIDKRKEQIEALEELVKSRFIEMFGDPVKNTKGWEYPKIENVVENEKNAIKAGPFGSALKKEYYIESGYKIYGQEQVISGDVNFGDYYISEEKYKELENCAVKSNDVLISLVGTYGKLLIIPEKFEAGIINPRLMKITFDKTIVNTIYFKYFFQSESLRNKLSDNTHGGTMPILNVGIVKNINIPLPPIELQNQFSYFVNQIDKLKFEMEKSLKELEDNFDSLMQKAFKGELFND